MITTASERQEMANPPVLPRLGFVGVGWIGRNRMASILESGCAEICALSDPNENAACEAASMVKGAVVAADLSDLLSLDLDGIVIATPSGMHSEQVLLALDHGLNVFCQKPLGRNAGETEAMVQKARSVNRNLGVDLSYRGLAGADTLRRMAVSGEIGDIYAADLVFHNAYGPDKPWYYDLSRSGGGCVMDLGVHLVDLALWILNYPDVEAVSSKLFAAGKPWDPGMGCVEDFAEARIDLANGAVIRLSCSWRISAGCDAVIAATFYGTEGGLSITNQDGSFYHFRADRFRSTSRETLSDGDMGWWGRTAVEWVRRLGERRGYDAGIEHQVTVARIMDSMYGRS